ncbi:hypothetical protein GPECTOR_24g294 [Gonium pectorale]|uniref:EF-hand domain-containing protein n=1 Tax=Gonium pectorale TaxID=33097 RepID=A0A150GGR2_GONPE|nr:hypothetical protein GPECTOR_24g294 [Gonium pectorale]|eukprot:KXZ49004.1 hypothetical protein GPECTOR_24g294 [Gonium pectorale]
MGLFSCFKKPESPVNPPAPTPEPAKRRSVKFAEEVENPLKDAPPASSSVRTPPPAGKPAPALKPSPAGAEPHNDKSQQQHPSSGADADAPGFRSADQRSKAAQLSAGGAIASHSPRGKAAGGRQGVSSSSAGGAQQASPRHAKATPRQGHGDAGQQDTAITSDSPSRWATSEAVKNLVVKAEGPASFAAALRPFTPEPSDAPVQQYITSLGKYGAGLVTAINAFPDVGHIFGAAYRLHKLASAVVVNAENASMLAALGQDVVRALDVAGKREAVPIESLEGLLSQLQEACEMVEVFGRDGWLLHMACNEHIKSAFDRHHNIIVEALEEAEVDVPGKTAPLPRGAYLDANRNLRRTLKRMGGGSVPQGLRMLGTDPLSPGMREVASQLGVPEEAVARELAALPADVPADAYYSRMVMRQHTAGGQDAATDRYMPIFTWYDRAGRGFLDRSALLDVLTDLGAFEGLKPAELEAAASRAFSLADQDGDGRVSPQEFARYYETLTCTNARKQLRLTLGLQGEEELKQIFHDFCAFGTRQSVDEMDNAHLVKLMKDCSLIGKDLSVADVDLAFAKAKPKGGRRLAFDGFLMALAECADRKGCELEELVRCVLSCRGPIAHATKADAVRLHDDKSTYTGVYAKGGPKVAQKGTDLGTMLDRSDPATAARKTSARPTRSNIVIVEKPVERGSPVQAAPPHSHPHFHSAGGGHGGPSGSGHGGPSGAGLSLSMRLSTGNGSRMSGAWKRRSVGSGVHAMSEAGSPLFEMWLMWAQFGAGSGSAASAAPPDMGVTQFIKMLRETGLLDKGFTAVNAELLFMRVKPKGSTRISFAEFEKALQLVADTRGLSRGEVEAAIMDSEGPAVTTTTPHRA